MITKSRILLSLGAALMFSTTNLQAQSAEEIVKKHTEAVGGTAAWSKVKSLRMTGASSVMGMDIAVTVSKVRGMGVRQDLEMQGVKNYYILTPDKGWFFMPVQGINTPTEIPAEQLKLTETQQFFGDLIVEMGDHGYRFESAGISTLDGKPVVPGKGTAESDQYFRLKALDKAGNASDLYIDMKTYHLVKMSRMVAVDGKEQEAAAVFADFRKQAEGIVVPMSQTNEMGELKISKVEVNPVIEASIFKP